jgi:hypothetical protein
MNDSSKNSDYFAPIMKQEVASVKCAQCGCDTVVNTVYLPYLVDGRIESCRQCRDAEFSR